jgi:Fur family zinc uptake transcriptional regulator
VCRACRTVAETDLGPVAAAMVRQAEVAGFGVERVTVEAEGLCAACAETGR